MIHSHDRLHFRFAPQDHPRSTSAVINEEMQTRRRGEGEASYVCESAARRSWCTLLCRQVRQVEIDDQET